MANFKKILGKVFLEGDALNSRIGTGLVLISFILTNISYDLELLTPYRWIFNIIIVSGILYLCFRVWEVEYKKNNDSEIPILKIFRDSDGGKGFATWNDGFIFHVVNESSQFLQLQKVYLDVELILETDILINPGIRQTPVKCKIQTPDVQNPESSLRLEYKLNEKNYASIHKLNNVDKNGVNTRLGIGKIELILPIQTIK